MTVTYDSTNNIIIITGAESWDSIYSQASSAGAPCDNPGDGLYYFACGIQIGDGSTVTDVTDDGVFVMMDASDKDWEVKANATFTMSNSIIIAICNKAKWNGGKCDFSNCLIYLSMASYTSCDFKGKLDRCSVRTVGSVNRFIVCDGSEIINSEFKCTGSGVWVNSTEGNITLNMIRAWDYAPSCQGTYFIGYLDIYNYTAKPDDKSPKFSLSAPGYVPNNKYGKFRIHNCPLPMKMDDLNISAGTDRWGIIEVYYTMKFRVLDVNRNPIESAEITIYDVDGNYVKGGLTDANGEFETEVMFARWEQKDGTDIEKKDYSPFRVKIEKEGYLTEYVQVSEWNPITYEIILEKPKPVIDLLPFAQTFERGETAIICTQVKDEQGNPVTDATVEFRLLKPDGTEVITWTTMTHVSGGIYVYQLATSQLDTTTYIIELKATKDTQTTTAVDTIKIEKYHKDILTMLYFLTVKE